MINKTVVGLGEVLWDMLPQGKELGGAPANFAYHVSQFGFDGYVVSAVGRDDAGYEIISTLLQKGVKEHISMVDFPTGSVEVKLDEQGVPEYNIIEDVAWDYIPYTDSMCELASVCSAVSFGTLAQRSPTSRDAILRFLGCMHPDALKIFDINLRQHYFTREVIVESLMKCNILKINDAEMVVVSSMLGYPDPDEIANQDGIVAEGEVFDTENPQLPQLLINARKLRQNFPNIRIIILTCGENGSVVVSDEGVSYLPTPKVEVQDTVGAGDSFSGAFCASLLKGESVGHAHKIAVNVSAYVCTCNGAMPDYPADKKVFL